MNYELAIINRLLDRYEGSRQSYTEEAKIKVIRLNVVSDKVFSYYWRDDAYNYRKDIEEAVAGLVKREIISSVIDENSGLLKYIILNQSNIDAAYSFVKRVKKTDIIADEKSVLETILKNSNKESVLAAFCIEMMNKLNNRKPHKEYFEDLIDLKLKCTLINEIERNEEEILLRNFSKKKFSDSKLLEKYSSFLLKAFNEFDSYYESFNELCEKHYIVKTPGHAFVKNGITFKINKQIINLDDLNNEFSLSDDAIAKMEILSLGKSKILTIENLTTFYYFNDPEYVVIYLGGFHNSTKRRLIEKLARQKEILEWSHFGDIDWGGLEILLDLRQKTGIYFKPYLMNTVQLKKYKNECSKLTQNDKKKLKQLAETNEEFKELIEYMLEHDVKLEQESIEFRRK